MSNAWFPEGSTFSEDREAAQVTVISGVEKFAYQTLNSLEGFESNGNDIIVTGETDPRHGQAWHHYRFYGRVRKWDGCIALLRVPAVSAAFRGYCRYSQAHGHHRRNPLSTLIEAPSCFTVPW